MFWYCLFRLAGIARWMPLRAAYFLGDAVATGLWWGWRSKRRIAIGNMLRVMGDRRAAVRAARYSFLNFARYNVDFLRAPKIKPEAILSKVHYDRWQEVDAAFLDGKGVIFVAMHFGNWDMGGAMMAARGYPVNVVADTYLSERTNALVVREREVRGMNVIPAERAAAGILRAMRRNEALAILIDTPMPDGVEVSFFGERTIVPAGPARIALRTGARVIPVAMPRASGTSDQIMAMADLDVRVVRTGDDQRDIQALTQRIFAAHERFIRAYPDQWYIFRPMWPHAAGRTATVEPALASER